MRASWWPDPPYIEISRAMAWDKGCNAMAKALIERIEELWGYGRSTEEPHRFVTMTLEQWIALKAEVEQ